MNFSDLKRIPALVIFGWSIISFFPVSADAHDFQDLNGHFSEPAVEYLADIGAVTTRNTDGTARTRFFPDSFLLRAELVKLALVSFSRMDDREISGGAPSFEDVRPADWFFSFVEKAKSLGAIEGTDSDHFEPERKTTKAEALKMIMESSGVELLTSGEVSYSDVSKDDWFYPYVLTGENLCLFPKTEEDTFFPENPVTRGETAYIISSLLRTLSGEDLCPSEKTEPDTPLPDLDEEAFVSVMLSPLTPPSRSVPMNAANVPFLLIDVTAPGSEAAKIVKITIQHSGLGLIEEIERVKIFVGITPYASKTGFSKETQTAVFSLSRNPIIIPAGETITVTIAADIAAEAHGGEHLFSIDSMADFEIIGVESGFNLPIHGDFPITGNTAGM